MKKLFNIFLLCLMALTATAQSSQTRRLQVKALPDRVFSIRLIYDVDYESYSVYNTTKDIDEQVPVGKEVEIDISVLGDYNGMEDFKLVGWKVNGVAATLAGEDHSNTKEYKFVMPNADTELVGTFEYDPSPDEDENPALGGWDPTTGTLIKDYEGSSWPLGFNFDEDRTKVLRFIEAGSFYGKNEYDYCVFSNWQFPYCNVWDISRTNSQSAAVSYYEEDPISLTEVILPATITKLKYDAFRGANLSTLVLYALTPPECGSIVHDYYTGEDNWKTPFPDCTDMTVRVPAEAVPLYQAADHWKDFTILAIEEDYADLTVNILPIVDAAKLALYKNMTIELTNLQSDAKRTMLVTERNSYVFRYLPTNTSYHIALRNAEGNEAGNIGSVYLEKENKSATFSNLKVPRTLTLTLLDSDKQKIDETLYTTTWMKSDKSFLKRGNQLSDVFDDMQIRLLATIGEELAKQYAQPDTLTYVVGQDSSYVLQMELPKQPVTTATFTVVDSLTQRGIGNATVDVQQILFNGKTGTNTRLTTNAKGIASGEVMATMSNITINAPDYGIKTFLANLADSTSFRKEFLAANGTTLILNHTWQAAVKKDETSVVEQSYSEGRSMNYTFTISKPNECDSVYNEYLDSYPIFTFYEVLPKGTKVKVTATSAIGNVDVAESVVTVGDEKALNVTLPIVERGHVLVTFKRTDANHPAALIISEETGRVVAKESFENRGYTEFTNLSAGQYLVAVMSKGIQFSTISSKEQLEMYTADKDYIAQSVEVTSGLIAEAPFTNVPLTTTILESNLTKRSVTGASSSVITVGVETNITAKVEFKDIAERIYGQPYDESKTPTDCQLEIYLPKEYAFTHTVIGVQLYRYYTHSDIPSNRNGMGYQGEYITMHYAPLSEILKIDGVVGLYKDKIEARNVPYQWDEAEHKLTIDWPYITEGGSLSVLGQYEEECTYTPEAYLNYTLNGKQYREVLESSMVMAEQSSIHVQETVVQPKITVCGTAPYYDENEAVQHVKHSSNGSSHAPLKDAQPAMNMIDIPRFLPVTIMDGDQPIGKAWVERNGNWEVTCELPRATRGSKHNIYAVIQPRRSNPHSYQTESKVVTYDPEAVVPLWTKMSFFNHHPVHLINTEVLFNYVTAKATPASYGYSNEEGYNTDFTFEANLSNNDTAKVYACYMFIWTEGPDAEVRATEAHYNARKGHWIAYEKFNTRTMPCAVEVLPLYHKDIIGSREEFDRAFQQGTVDTERKALINRIGELKTIIDGGEANADIVSELSDIINKLNARVGIDFTQVDGSAKTIEELLEESNNFSNKIFEIQEAEELISKPLNQIGDLVAGINITTANGETHESLKEKGYALLLLDDGSFVYLLNKDGYIAYIDLKQNIKIEIGSVVLNLLRRASTEELVAKLQTIKEEIVNAIQVGTDALLNIDAFIEKEEAWLADAMYQFDRMDPNDYSGKTSLGLQIATHLGWVSTLKNGLDVTNWMVDTIDASKGLADVLGKLKGVLSFIDHIIKQGLAMAELEIIKYHIEKEVDKGCGSYNFELLYNEITEYKKSARNRYDAVIVLDIAGLAGATSALKAGVASLTVGQVGATAASVAGFLAAGAAVVATMWYANSVADEIEAKLMYFKNEFSLLSKSCEDTRNCMKRNDCEKCWESGDCLLWPPYERIRFKKYRRPKTDPTLDPSGFVYEAVESNRLEGVTTTVFYKATEKDIFGEEKEISIMWDAENYDQINPQQTDKNGEYGWMVPSGMWQVKYEKSGYQTEYSEWLPVPPPQLDVNQNMTQVSAPVVNNVKATQTGVLVTFDKFMATRTLTKDNISIIRNGAIVEGTVAAVEPHGLGEQDMIAQKVHFIPATSLPVGEKLTLTVNGDVESYAGVPMGDDFQQEFDIVQAVEQLVADSAVHVIYDEATAITILAIPAAAAVGKKASVQVISDMIASADKQELTFDAQGKATLTITGEAYGTTAAVVKMEEDEEVKATVVIEVKDNNDFVCPMPTANYQPSQSYQLGTLIELHCELPEATIYYTLDGTCPCAETSPSVKKYEAPIPLTAELIIKAFAKAPGYADSDVAELKFMVDAIQTIPVSYKVPTATYTLQGVKVNDSQPLRKGLYIRGNKKIIVR